MCLSTSGNYTQVEILTMEQLRKIHEDNEYLIVDEFFSTVPGKNFDLCIISTRTKTHTPFHPHRVKWHKIIMIYPQPVRRHYHLKYTLITLAPVSYLRSLVVRAVHRHRIGVGSIPAGGPYS